MKKGIIAIVALAAAAGISIGAFFAVKSKSEKETKQEEISAADNVLFELDENTLTKIQIDNSDGNYTAELTDGIWKMTDSTDNVFDLKQDVFSGICTFISNLTADTSYGEANDENKQKYGLSDPYTITVYDGDNSHVLYIGDLSPTGDYYYAYTSEKNNIYAISASDGESLIFDRIGLKNDSFVPYTDNEIVGMTLKKDGNVVYNLTFDKATGLWNLPEEYSMLTVNQTKPANMVTLITRLTAEIMYPESDDDIKTFNFDKPAAEFIVTGADGTQRTILMSHFGNDSKTYTHTYMTDSKQVEVYFTSDLKFIDYEVFDFITQSVENANMYSITDFEINCSELSDKFTFDSTSMKAECRGTEIDLNNAELKSYFETFYNTFSYLNITGIDIEAEPKLEDPVFSVKYTFKDGTSTAIDLVSAGNESECYIFANGEYTGTLTDPSFMTGTYSMLSAYENLCKQSDLTPNN